MHRTDMKSQVGGVLEEQARMKLKGACQCGAVSFECDTKHPYPYQLCYCGICRKTQGGGGFAINLAADAASLSVVGRDNTSVYRAKMPDGRESIARRVFCKTCASFMWLEDPRWPELINPFASAVETELPVPPERTHIMLSSKASWVSPDFGPKDKKYDEYPEESIAEWHQRLGLEK